MKRLLRPFFAAGCLLPMPGLLAQVEYVDPTIGGGVFMLGLPGVIRVVLFDAVVPRRPARTPSQCC
jgi:hypothetical protein